MRYVLTPASWRSAASKRTFPSVAPMWHVPTADWTPETVMVALAVRACASRAERATNTTRRANPPYATCTRRDGWLNVTAPSVTGHMVANECRRVKRVAPCGGLLADHGRRGAGPIVL